MGHANHDVGAIANTVESPSNVLAGRSMPRVPDLVSLGLLGLFVAAFLAGSVLPFPSEGVLAALVYNGSAMTPAVLIATAGNV